MFEIYGRKNCSWCDAAKALLERKGFSYSYYDIEEDKDALADFRRLFPTAKTVPQIMAYTVDVDGTDMYHYVGGFSDLEKFV